MLYLHSPLLMINHKADWLCWTLLHVHLLKHVFSSQSLHIIIHPPYPTANNRPTDGGELTTTTVGSTTQTQWTRQSSHYSSTQTGLTWYCWINIQAPTTNFKKSISLSLSLPLSLESPYPLLSVHLPTPIHSLSSQSTNSHTHTVTVPHMWLYNIMFNTNTRIVSFELVR